MSRQNYDATFCGKQPLHQTNQIQPHGILLVVSKSDLQVVQVSENIPDVIDAPEKVLNRSLADILTSAAYQEVKAKSLNLRHAVSVQLAFKHDDSRCYLALMHEKDECLIVEVEFSNAMHSGGVTFDAFFSGLQSVMSAINGAKTVEEVASISAREIKRLTGFDKVMIYSFDDEWNGTVIAEDMNDGMDEYLGLKFPASDVPKQARDLYLKNPYRIIPNRAYKPVRLTPEINPVSGLYTNLSDARLRSVVPVHIEYLENMNVMASMSTRIIHKEQLWGLIACHNKTEKYLSLSECSVFEVLSNVISSKISSIVNHNSYSTNIRLNDYYNHIVEHLAVFDNLINALSNHKEALLSMLGADGVAICWNGEVATVGLTPEVRQIEGLREWLVSKGFSKVLTLHCLSGAFEEARTYAAVASGLLALPIQPYQGNYILAFRGEIIQKVTWGGNPDEVIVFEKNSPVYHPRNSFQVWKETVRNTSAPWSSEELAVAERFRNVVVEHTLQTLANSLERKVKERTRALEKNKNQLEQTFSELMQFTYVASHDLQEPVRKIQIYGQRLKSVLEDQSANQSLDRVLAASKRISDLLADLINYSKLSDPGNPSLVDLNQVLKDVVKDLDLLISDRKAKVEFNNLPLIEAVPDQMRQMFFNLIDNSIKFAREGAPLNIDISGETIDLALIDGLNARGPYCRITVKDNGIGFNQEYADQIFGMFRKLHSRDEYEGTGIGLAITRKIVEKHDGVITASGIENEGASFTITLPVKQSKKKPEGS